jgi:protein-L-isoaspartate(D-aspartate) O-methyltransferase
MTVIDSKHSWKRQMIIMPQLVAVLLSVLMMFPACAEQGEMTVMPTPSSPLETEAGFTDARNKMVEQQIQGRGVSDPRVLIAMENVPRHRFVPQEYLREAYSDHPLPIGYGQTISQPYIVALMTEYLALQPQDKVLEIGTGSGYQAAILSELSNHVYTVEIIEPLGQRASATLKELGYDVYCKVDDGYYGWPEYSPFDTIIVTCAPDHVPQPLTEQLKEGGRLVIPVGPPGAYQTLWLIEKKGDEFRSTNLGSVRFVPMLGER